MELAELQKHWTAFGAQDPLWAILTLPGKRFGQWNVDDFFANGRAQVGGQMKRFEGRGLTQNRRRALDFGCGVGRLTQALGDFYQECDGVDISPSMVENARKFNRHGERCRYHVNGRNDLSLFADDTFDLVFTVIVLQHMQPKYAARYIEEFVRVIAPGGLAFFQIPAGPEEPTAAGPERRRGTLDGPLPDSAYRAKLSLVDQPTTLWAGSRVELVVRVQNLSDVTWKATSADPHRYWINLGNHWFDEHRQHVNFDDARSGLPWDLEPGATVELPLSITVPAAPGRYLLELDMVQEYAAWFRDRGSETLLVPIEVKTPPAGFDFNPEIQMYSTPKDEVIALVEAQGGVVLETEQVNKGAGLVDYNYYVTKQK